MADGCLPSSGNANLKHSSMIIYLLFSVYFAQMFARRVETQFYFGFPQAEVDCGSCLIQQLKHELSVLLQIKTFTGSR